MEDPSAAFRARKSTVAAALVGVRYVLRLDMASPSASRRSGRPRSRAGSPGPAIRRITAACWASFSPKKASVRLDDVEQLGHHRRHAAEVPGAHRAFQRLGQPLHRDPGLEPGRVHPRASASRPGRRRLPRASQVARQVARVRGQVLVRAELGRVDEDAHHDQLASLQRGFHQAKCAPRVMSRSSARIRPGMADLHVPCATQIGLSQFSWYLPWQMQNFRSTFFSSSL